MVNGVVERLARAKDVRSGSTLRIVCDDRAEFAFKPFEGVTLQYIRRIF